MQMKYFMGIDPGTTNGSMIIIDQEGIFIEECRFAYTEKGKRVKLTHLEIYGFIARYGNTFKPITLIEQPRFRNAVLTRHVGYLEGVLHLREINFKFISARKWQKGLGYEKKGNNESKTQHKTRLRDEARKLFPNFMVKIVKENCDALLIAEYARRQDE